MKRHYHCKKHPEQELICPRCVGSKGGKTTGRTHSHRKLSTWGKMGGRPRKSAKKRP